MKTVPTSDGRFRIGDACYYEFELSTVDAIYDGHIQSVIRGGFRTTSQNLDDSCFPLTPEVASASAYVATLYTKLCNLNFNALNYPDIHWGYTLAWIAMCEADEDFTRNYAKNQLTVMHNKIVSEIERLRKIKVKMRFLGEDTHINIKIIRQ